MSNLVGGRLRDQSHFGTREGFGIFRVLRLDINLFFGENNVFNMFWVNEKLLEAFILLSVQF